MRTLDRQSEAAARSRLGPVLLVVAVAWTMSGPTAVLAEDPAAGKLLIASRGLLDPNFTHTVILLVEHSSDGAMGVILNRPTQVAIEEMVPDIESPVDRPVTVWIGGPVAHWQMVLLYRSDAELEGSKTVFDRVFFSASRLVLEQLLEEGGEFRIYAGYAGWAPGQLEAEIARGGWHVLPGDADSIFDPAPRELWRELISRGEAKWVDLGKGSPTWSSARTASSR